jgi:glutamate-1-semialdehyde 2,1-aminomutase
MAKRVVSLLPGYEFSEAQFFSCDGAPESVVSNRKLAFYQLADLLQKRHAKSIALTAEAREIISRVLIGYRSSSVLSFDNI